jgi:hypothetical protein
LRSNAVLGCVAVLVSLAAGAPLCRAQYPEDFHPYVVDAGAGWTGVRGADKRNFGAFGVYQAGGGFALTSARPEVPSDDAENPTVRHWNVFVKGEFMYGQSDLTELAVQQIINSNPQNPSLLSATTGKGKFYSTTLGPRVQYSRRWFSVYGQGGLGWLRRSIDLTGMTTAGTVLQPNSPLVFVRSGNSGALQGTLGIAAGGKGVRAFVDIGLLQGFAINHGTMLAPILSGGVRW